MANAASKSSNGRTRAERLEARVTAEQKSLIERAAALQGRTLTDFVLTSVQDAARRAIEEHHQFALSVRDSEAFVDALLNAQPVNDRLRDTVRLYRERTGV
jgi:uncharacterized protein (DUF1778 family)